MNHLQKNPALVQVNSDDHIDYSEMYRNQETIQLNKKLRRTRNVLLASAAALVLGAIIFWVLPGTIFTTTDILLYIGLAGIILLLSVFSNKQPYFSVLAALVICLGFWGAEVFFNTTESILIERSIQKLFIISLLASSFHCSREAELIRKELYFS